MSDAALSEDGSLESLVGRVADEFLSRQERGENPDLEEYAARHPHAAGLLRNVLTSLRLIDQSGVGVGSSLPSGEAGAAEPLGDFCIVREVGRGGMGVVYEAVQLSLGRRVALKVLPLAAALDARQLRRFQNEAQAAAHLHHQHIVPVYAVGCERGLHFYAMQFIEGRTLAEVIADLRADPPAAVPSPDTLPLAGLATERTTRPPEFFRTIARLGLQAAEALAHAHQEGIVHRDIKPANLLVDARGNLWVTDFGLARLQNEAGLTLSGDLLGTLRYMSPEQALGYPAAVDQRTDVYSLGATLYELLALCPVFDGRDRQELLRRIASEEPRPPRRVNPAVPAELEVIVRKALEKEPAARYTAAQELADDLRRFLEDKPIRARRPSWLEQARRWVRRHRPVVWSAVAALLATLAVLAGCVGWVVRDRSARQVRTATEVRAALDEAQRLHGQRQWREAHAAARRAEALLAADQDGSTECRQRVRELLADLDMVVRLEEVRLQGARVNDGRFDLDCADRRYAAAFRAYGIDVEALDAEEAARLIRARPVRVELAALDFWARRRRLLPRKGGKGWLELLAVARSVDPDPRRTALRDAVASGDGQALVAWAASADVRSLPPVTLVLLAAYLAEMRSRPAATALLRRAHEHHAHDFWINHHLADLLVEARPPRLAEAIRFYTAAVALRPESPGARLNLGVALASKGRLEEALAAYRHAIELNGEYAEAHCNVGKTLWEMGKQDEAIVAHRKAIALKPHLAQAHNNLGHALAHHGRLEEAVAAYRRAIELLRNTRRLKPYLALAWINLGNALGKLSQRDEALAALRSAGAVKHDHPPTFFKLGRAWTTMGQLDEASAAYRQAIHLQPNYAEAHDSLGVVLSRMGRLEESVAAHRRAIELKPDLVLAHFNLGLDLAKRGRLDEAIMAYRRAIELQPNLATAHYSLGNTLVLKRRTSEAVAAYRQAIALQRDHAEAHCNLAVVLRNQGEFAAALATMKRGHELGSRRPDWPYPSARWVEECQRLVDEPPRNMNKATKSGR
jgi:tetratricopeptide (TPR) repeat protein